MDAKINPEVQKVKQQEQGQIKKLNNIFASSIHKVQFLEQQNQVLEIKWELLGVSTHSNSLQPTWEGYTSQHSYLFDGTIN